MALSSAGTGRADMGELTTLVIDAMNKKIQQEVSCLQEKRDGESLSSFQKLLMDTVNQRKDVAAKIHISKNTIQWTDNGRSEKTNWMAEHMVDLRQVVKNVDNGKEYKMGRIDIGGVHADATALQVPMTAFTATFMKKDTEITVPVGSNEYKMSLAQVLAHEEFTGGTHDDALKATENHAEIFKNRTIEIYKKLNTFFEDNQDLTVATYFSVMIGVLDDQNYQMALEKNSYGSSTINMTHVQGIPTQINLMTPQREQRLQGAVHWTPGNDGMYKQMALGFKIQKTDEKFGGESQSEMEGENKEDLALVDTKESEGLNLNTGPARKKFKASYVSQIALPYRELEPKYLTKGAFRGGATRGCSSAIQYRRPALNIPPVTVCKCSLDYENPLHEVKPIQNFNFDKIQLEKKPVATFSLVLNIDLNSDWGPDQIAECTEKWWTDIFQGLLCMWSDFGMITAEARPTPILEQKALVYDESDEEARLAMANRIANIHQMFTPGHVNLDLDDV